LGQASERERGIVLRQHGHHLTSPDVFVSLWTERSLVLSFSRFDFGFLLLGLRERHCLSQKKVQNVYELRDNRQNCGVP